MQSGIKWLNGRVNVIIFGCCFDYCRHEETFLPTYFNRIVIDWNNGLRIHFGTKTSIMIYGRLRTYS